MIKEGSRLPVNDQEVISGIRDEEEEDIPQSTSTPSDNKGIIRKRVFNFKSPVLYSAIIANTTYKLYHISCSGGEGDL